MVWNRQRLFLLAIVGFVILTNIEAVEGQQRFRLLDPDKSAPNVRKAPHEWPPFAHWDLREFEDCRVPWVLGTRPVPDLDGNGMDDEPVDRDIAQVAFEYAFGLWEAVDPCSEIKFTNAFVGQEPEGGFQEDGWNTLSFSDIDLPQSALAATCYFADVSTGRIREADIVFNSQTDPIFVSMSLVINAAKWVVTPHQTALDLDLDYLPFGNWPNPFDGDTDEDGDGNWENEIDLRTIAAHEIGHFLGLAHAETLGTAHNDFNNGIMEELWISGIGPDTNGWTNIVLKDIDRDGLNFLYCPDLGDAPDPWAGIDGSYPTKIRDPDNGRILNGLQLDDVWIGAEHIFGIKPRQPSRNWTYEWLAFPNSGGVDGECYPNMVDLDLPYDDGLTFFPDPPIWKRMLYVTAWIRYAADGAGNAHDYSTDFLWLNSWIDLNQDGIWDAQPGDPEWFMESASFSPPAPANPNEINFIAHTDSVYLPIPPDPDRPVWLRTRLDYGEDVGRYVANGVDGTLIDQFGAAQFGEVEDYQFWCTTVYEMSEVANTLGFEVSNGLCHVYPGAPSALEETYWAEPDSLGCGYYFPPPPMTFYDPTEDETRTQFPDPVQPGERRKAGKCKPDFDYLMPLRMYWVPQVNPENPPPEYWIPSAYAMLCFLTENPNANYLTVNVGVPAIPVGGWIGGGENPEMRVGAADSSIVWDDSLDIEVWYRAAPEVLPLDQLSQCDSTFASLPKIYAGSATITPDQPMRFTLQVPQDVPYGQVLIVEVESSWSTNETVNHQILEFPYTILEDPTDAGDPTPDVPQLALKNYPNPFNPTTTIRYTLPEPATVTLRVFDVAGRMIRTLVSAEPKTAGPHEILWDARDDRGESVATGVYFYQLIAGDRVLTGRGVLLK